MGHVGTYSNTVHTLIRDVVVLSLLQYRIYTTERCIVTSQGTVSLIFYSLLYIFYTQNPS